MKQFPSESIDLVVTDPPYVVNYRDRQGRTIPNDDHFGWLEPAFREIFRVLKPHRLCVSFYGWANAEKFLGAWKAAGFRPVGHLVWVKGYTASTRFVQHRHEAAYLLAKGSPSLPRTKLPDVLRWHYSENRLHPSEKSVVDMDVLIDAYSSPGEIVLDPFMGSGSTLVTAQKSGRRFLGIELDETYFQNAARRLRHAA